MKKAITDARARNSKLLTTGIVAITASLTVSFAAVADSQIGAGTWNKSDEVQDNQTTRFLFGLMSIPSNVAITTYSALPPIPAGKYKGRDGARYTVVNQDASFAFLMYTPSRQETQAVYAADYPLLSKNYVRNIQFRAQAVLACTGTGWLNWNVGVEQIAWGGSTGAGGLLWGGTRASIVSGCPGGIGVPVNPFAIFSARAWK